MTPRVADLRRRRDAMVAMLEALDDTALAELVRRAGVSARPNEEGPGDEVLDGFGSGREGGTHDAAGASPTEATVLAAAGGRLADPVTRTGATPDTWRRQYDPVGQLLNDLFATMAEAHGVLLQMDRCRQAVFATGENARGRQSSLAGICEACGRDVSGMPNDRLISGYDVACYHAWRRAGFPNRSEFRRDRRRAS